MSESGVCALCGLRYGDPVDKLLQEVERLRNEIERLTRERDEWQAKFMGPAWAGRDK